VVKKNVFCCQNLLRNQNNKSNFNLVSETLMFLDCICGSTTGGLGLLGLYINEGNVALINQTLETLTEYCQGRPPVLTLADVVNSSGYLLFLLPTLIPLSGVGSTCFHHVVIKIRHLFLRPAACLTSTLLETVVDANNCKCSRDQQLNVPSEARRSS
jgi:hypothetical protein